ncbi:hypothetical protein B0T20DRAFT_397825 [Sordaria brevicollis]|uniref:Uncharacterized protein n=1 Tax=Sordaria brevicollis TaxID=83679 RepID=A0AAE0U2B6_SORBR|nr:hypothetical protein B0T20DRAFT_397825 [Sordaria brevicollis]
MAEVSRNDAARSMISYLEQEFDFEDWEFEIAEALKKFGVKYEELSALDDNKPEDDPLRSKWHDYFILSLNKIVRDLPSNNLDDVSQAVEKLEREDIEAKAKKHGGRVTFPPKNENNKRPAEVQTNQEISDTPEEPANKRAKTDKDRGLTFKTAGAYAVRITDDADNSSKLNFDGHGPVTVTLFEKDSAPVPGLTNSRLPNGLKVKVLVPPHVGASKHL